MQNNPSYPSESSLLTITIAQVYTVVTAFNLRYETEFTMTVDHPAVEHGNYPLSTVLWQASGLTATTQESLVLSVFEMIWKQIVEGERQQGERLIASELASELGVSRTPVQQALYQLQQVGLVAATTGRGFHVVIFSADDVRDLYDLRTILEVAATKIASSRLGNEALYTELATIEQLRNSPESELGPRFLTNDVAFHHELIAGNTGNRRLAEAIAKQRAQMSIFLVGGTRAPGGITAALNEHEQIIQALLARDVEQAAAAMAKHITRVRDDALRLFAHQPPQRIRRFLAQAAV